MELETWIISVVVFEVVVLDFESVAFRGDNRAESKRCEVVYFAFPPLVASRNSTFFFTTGSYLSMLRGRCTRGRIIVR